MLKHVSLKSHTTITNKRNLEELCKVSNQIRERYEKTSGT